MVAIFAASEAEVEVNAPLILVAICVDEERIPLGTPVIPLYTTWADDEITPLGKVVPEPNPAAAAERDTSVGKFMIDDVKIILAEYRLALKRNHNASRKI